MMSKQNWLLKGSKLVEVKKRHIIGSVVGNACEWYDYVIYASLAPVLATVFFPKSDKVVGLMLTFVVFAAGFLIRPVGGMVFGNIADKYGRKRAFIYSIVLMALPALAIGLLPSYDSAGRLSVLLLLFFRLLQGMAIGGEYPTMITYIAELSPPERRGYIGSYASVTTVAGVLAATITVAIITKTLSHADLISFGWRIPFFITFVTILVGYYIRLKLPESMLFLAEKIRSTYPVLDAVDKATFIL